MNNLDKAVAGVNETEEAKALLLASGIAAFQNRAAFLPLQTSDSLPETETQFSERTRSQRKTQDIRTKQWIQHLNRFTATDNPILLSFDDMKQIEFITQKVYLLHEPMDIFLEAIEKEIEPLSWLDRGNEGNE